MFIARFVKRFYSFARVHKKSGLNNLHSVKKMQRILILQRALADRHGREFSLVAFSLPDSESCEADVCRLASALLGRCRSTDVVGWLSENQIGVVLPFTSGEAAWKFADNACKIMAETSIHQKCNVYTYPSDWLQKDGCKPQLGSVVDPQFIPRIFLRSSESTESDSNVTPLPLGESATCRGIISSKPIQPLEALFVRPLQRWKRTLDIVGSLVGLVVASPLMVAAAFAIKLTSKGPVFFVQKRTGQGCCRFKMYKFRTMVNGAEKQREQVSHLNGMSGPLIKIDRDPRLTKVGSLLRKTSIDELPQLFNVIKGDMTIIGPRALSPLPTEFESWQLRRFAVKPGIACTWQAERRAERDFREWMRCDLSYMDRASFWTDMQVLFKTALQVLGRNGAC